MNAFSLWMVSSLITTIMLPNNVNEKTEVINNGVYYKLEFFAQNLIGHGSQIEQLKILCILLFCSFLLKNIFYYINNISLAFV